MIHRASSAFELKKAVIPGIHSEGGGIVEVTP
jgi:hypothetical protein